jgi:hypothetical protein
LDWVSGPGGAEAAPQPPFRFLKESREGTNPKIDVVDATGRTWVVKFGEEIHSETFAARFLNAVGYHAVPTFYVPNGVVAEVSGLKRARPFIKKDGSFRKARFKLAQHHKHPWSWAQNPCIGTRELGGLKIMVMLLSNWDTKDSRDGVGTNNAFFDDAKADSVEPTTYAVTDWGASLGKSGGFFERDRWNWRGYRQQTARFVRVDNDGSIDWGFRGKHGQDITANITVEDVRWLLPYLTRITDEELAAGLTASGASAPAVTQFTWAIRQRVKQLERVADAGDVPEVGSK